MESPRTRSRSGVPVTPGATPPATGGFPASAATPDRRAALGESGGALAGVLGGEDGADDLVLAVPHLLGSPGGRRLHDLLGRGHGQRPVAGDDGRQFDRRIQRRALVDDAVDQSDRGGPLGVHRLAGEQQLERHRPRHPLRQEQGGTAGGNEEAFTPGAPKPPPRAATTRSQASSSSNPPASAPPSTAAISGLRGGVRVVPHSPRPSMAGLSPRRNAFRSIPEGKKPPAPVRTAARSSSDASSSSTAAATPCATAASSALRACGRLMVMTCTAPRRSTRTSSDTCPPSEKRTRGPGGTRPGPAVWPPCRVPPRACERRGARVLSQAFGPPAA